jgi:hypothetical protein
VTASIFLVFAGVNHYPTGDGDLRGAVDDLSSAEAMALTRLRDNNDDWASVIELVPPTRLTSRMLIERLRMHSDGTRVHVKRSGLTVEETVVRLRGEDA